MNNQPKVSCLCVSRGGEHLLQAIKDFKVQTWPNKELIVIHSSWPEVQDDPANYIEVFRCTDDLTVGARRNLLVSASTGEWVCIWDDDDRHHPERIALQMAFKSGLGSTLAQIHIQDRNGDYWVSEKRPTGWEGTLLCAKEVLKKHPYADEFKQEDAHIGSLFKKYRMAAVPLKELYVYRLHADNVSGDAHRKHLIRNASALVPCQVDELKAKWEGRL